ncbi:NAD(P)/FAD-dependent oxidoreductase [Aquimarina sp. W85]|uniref:NAD(P)/FAD-dependent oxidoreductase n=1 Tax=Aquimarina rhodophyticola TaxID=3342246 RepID=UPI0036717312
MNQTKEIIIIGGGLAGLTAAIHLASHKFKVVLIEKNEYPTHKVCGEYISNEILPYWRSLGITIDNLKPTTLKTIEITTQKGKRLQSKLPLGGFGVSRYYLDQHLYILAKTKGIHVLQDQVVNVLYHQNKFSVETKDNGTVLSNFVIGAFGKRSGLDKTLQRSFMLNSSPWLAVKAHYAGKFPEDLVALHNFEGGYCGISKVEDNTINVCYLAHYDSFKKYKNINDFQNKVLCANPHLNNFFLQATCLFDKPLSISQINFERKSLIHNHMFMLGDAAGMIHPLCGNGMAMAIQSAQLLCQTLIENTTYNTFDRSAIESSYKRAWKKQFSNRLAMGSLLQSVVLNPYLQRLGYYLGNSFPSTLTKIIKQTHGKPIEC